MRTFNIEIFNCVTGEFDLGNVIVESHEVGYVRDDRTGNAIVTLIGTATRIMVLPGAFKRITGVDIHRSYAGRFDSGRSTVIELGFILPEGVNANVRHADLLLPA